MTKGLGFISFSSGSSGNCYYLGDGKQGILIDAGVSLKRLKQGLESAKMDFNSFSGILVTHDHMDHIRSLGSYCKKLIKPVYTSELLHKVFANHFITRSYFGLCGRILEKDTWNVIGDFLVRYFVVPHDATETIGFAINYKEHKYVHITDIGRMTEEALDFCAKADTVVIESNYDTDLLLSGSYPHDLKMRICQGQGHLSNEECANAIKSFYHKGLRNLFLCHLSNNNNTPTLAYESALKALQQVGVQKGEINLRALPRTESSSLIYLNNGLQ